ncbi:hypothetical protein NG798_09375 [Ancylothrix sp. C2]|uniref:hypothetical protein n=1 Tax=Ancylothrix sp. D3o TaxID=2953691 RepID=UPI0021BAB9D6|nr:hypothetical protein [Ancylothrix sp. D3o]MCT7949996.1 hypothetical protein [Ancylothrix sp. D3o]
MARFTDIERAAELQAAKTALEAWRALTREAKQTAFRGKMNGGRVVTDRIDGYIKPFGVAAAANTVLKCQILGPNAPSITGGTAGVQKETATEMVGLIIAALGSRARTTVNGLTTPPAGTEVWTAIAANKFKFAKVLLKNKDATGTQQTSRFTNISYTSYPSQSVSAPFGQEAGSAIETFEAASTAIKGNAGLNTWVTAANTTRSLKVIPQLTSLS